MNKRLKALIQIRPKDIKVELAKEYQILQGLRQKKPLVLYAGWTGQGNLGDEILFQAHQKLFPHFYFVPCRQPSLANLYAKVAPTPAYVAGFLGGGTLINQSPVWLKRMQHIHQKGLPIFCFGTGVTEDAFRLDFEKTTLAEGTMALKEFDYVGIRGPRSQALLQQAGFSNAQVIGDTALALAPEKVPPHQSAKIVGVNFGLVKKTQIWGDSRTFTVCIAETIKQLIKAGYEVRLLPVWAEDLESNRALLQLVDNSKCTLRPCFEDLESYNKELQQCRLFIGQKLHATIMATMQRIPSLMIAYQPKCQDYMASIGMEACTLKTSECMPEKLLQKCNWLEQHASEVRVELDAAILAYRAKQYLKASEIEEKILKRASRYSINHDS